MFFNNTLWFPANVFSWLPSGISAWLYKDFKYILSMIVIEKVAMCPCISTFYAAANSDVL